MNSYLASAVIALHSMAVGSLLISPPMTVAVAAQEEVTGSVIPIVGQSERMISYRQQRHMWVTPDDAIHTVINQGEDGDSQALALYSSFDRGSTWTLMAEIENTNDNSTSDGFLLGGRQLHLSYSTSNGEVFHLTLNYNARQQSWITDSNNLVFSSQIGTVASNSTVMIDRNRQLWIAFVGTNQSNQTFIRLYNSVDAGQSWVDTEINFGAINTSVRKSPVLIQLRDSVGIIYTNDDSFYLARRGNDEPLDAPWQTELVIQLEAGSNSDPFASHFSVITDRSKNIHLATRENGRLLYLRFNQSNQTWDIAKYLTNDVNVGYMQIAVTLNDEILVVANQGSNLLLFNSQDSGETFNSIAKLIPDQQSLSSFADIDLSRPRMEMPSVVNNYLPIVQQFVGDDLQRLLYFDINL